MMQLDSKVLADIHAHAAAEYARSRECCGLVIIFKGRQMYVPCANRAQANEEFVIDEQDWADAEDRGEVVMVVHSHVGVPPVPSQPDMVGIERSQLPWLIINMPTGKHTITEPTGYQAPLVGRTFAHGSLDCLALIIDYYRQELGITLNDYKREDRWWLAGGNMYRDLYAECGFVPVGLDEIRKHDVLFMRISPTPVENHGAVYIGDSQILHHPMNRLSGRDVYGGYWRKITSMAVRHKELL